MTEKEEDFLSVDTPIPGQNYACLSFVSPEKELANKDLFFIHSFLKHKAKDFNLSEGEVVEQYKDYLYNNSSDLEKTFYEREDFQTTMRGVKVRGVYDTYREAQVRAKLLQKKDKNFHVFVGQVGYWLPWDPNADEVADQEYSESQLNKLVKKYQENTKKRDTFFMEQKEESLQKLKEENNQSENRDTTDNADNADNVESTTPKQSPQDSLQDMDPWMKRKLEQEANNKRSEGDSSDQTSEPSQSEVTSETPNTEDNVIDLDA